MMEEIGELKTGLIEARQLNTQLSLQLSQQDGME